MALLVINDAVKEAFGVSRRTLFRWQKKLDEALGKLEGLNPKNTAPNNRRKRITTPGAPNVVDGYTGLTKF